MFYVSNALQTLVVTSMTLTTSTSGTKGGVFYINSAASVTLTSVTASLFSSPALGSFMHSLSTTVVLTLTSNDLKCLSAAYVYATNL